MSPDQRKRFDAEAQTRMERKERLFEHLKYNMNSDRPGTSLLKGGGDV